MSLLDTNTFTVGVGGLYMIRATGATLSTVEALDPPYPLGPNHPFGPVPETWAALPDDAGAAIATTNASTLVTLGEGMVLRANPAPAGGTYLEIIRAEN